MALDTLTSSIAWLQERAAIAEWPVPDTPEALVSWALDELMVQIELVRDFPLRGYRKTPALFSLTKIVDIKLNFYLVLLNFGTVLLDYRTIN